MGRGSHTNTPLHHVTLPNVHFKSNGKFIYGYTLENFDPSHPAFQGHSRSLEPTWNDTVAYDLLVMGIRTIS